MANDAWRRNGVLYRVDPRLFRDGDGDGVGDLQGLAGGLGYLHWLGVDGLWLTFDEAPPDPAFDGLLPVTQHHAMGLVDGAAWRRLTAEAHRLGIRIVIDGWAEADRVRREGGRALRDDPPGGGRRGARTDLSLRLAFENGIDAVWADDGWALPAPAERAPALAQGAAPVAERTAIATAPARIRTLFEPDPLDRGCVDGATPRPAPWSARSLAASLHRGDEARRAGSAAPFWLLAPTDAPRAAGYLGDDLAHAAAALLLTAAGTATVVSGDELGLADGGALDGGPGARRDGPPERAAIPWDERPGGGFAPWPWAPMAVAGVEPVSRQRLDHDSLLSFYRKAIALRRSERAISDGTLTPVAVEDGLLALLREDGATRFLVAVNAGPEPLAVRSLKRLNGHVALASRRSREGTRVSGELRLGAHDAMVIRLCN